MSTTTVAERKGGPEPAIGIYQTASRAVEEVETYKKGLTR